MTIIDENMIDMINKEKNIINNSMNVNHNDNNANNDIDHIDVITKKPEKKKQSAFSNLVSNILLTVSLSGLALVSSTAYLTNLKPTIPDNKIEHYNDKLTLIPKLAGLDLSETNIKLIVANKDYYNFFDKYLSDIIMNLYNSNYLSSDSKIGKFLIYKSLEIRGEHAFLSVHNNTYDNLSYEELEEIRKKEKYKNKVSIGTNIKSFKTVFDNIELSSNVDKDDVYFNFLLYHELGHYLSKVILRDHDNGINFSKEIKKIENTSLNDIIFYVNNVKDFNELKNDLEILRDDFDPTSYERVNNFAKERREKVYLNDDGKYNALNSLLMVKNNEAVGDIFGLLMIKKLNNLSDKDLSNVIYGLINLRENGLYKTDIEHDTTTSLRLFLYILETTPENETIKDLVDLDNLEHMLEFSKMIAAEDHKLTINGLNNYVTDILSGKIKINNELDSLIKITDVKYLFTNADYHNAYNQNYLFNHKNITTEYLEDLVFKYESNLAVLEHKRKKDPNNKDTLKERLKKF